MIRERTFTNLNNKVKNSTLICQSMFKLARQSSINIRLIRPTLSTQVDRRGMAFYYVSKYKSPAAKQFATDGNGCHLMQNRISCDNSDCTSKVCKTPCTGVIKSETTGHYTHKPPQSTTSEHLSNTDITGQKKRSAFCKT